MVELAAFGARVLVDDGASLGIDATLAQRFPEGFVRATTETSAAARYRVTRDVPRGYTMQRDELAVERYANAASLLDRLCARLELDLAVHARGYTFVHAGVVAWRGAAILVPGLSGTGKSTLVAELVRLGAEYYSDDWAVLDDTGKVHPFPRPIALRDKRAVAPETPREARPPLCVALIVATTFRPGCAWEPAILRGARALLPVVDNAVVVEEQPARVLRVAAALGSGIATIESPRPDAEAVAPAILDFADAVRAGRLAHFTSVRRTHAASLGARAGDVGATPPLAKSVRCAPYVRVEEFLSADEHRQLLDLACSREADFSDSGVYREEKKLHDPYVRRSRTLYDIDERCWAFFEPRLRRLIPHLRRELGIPWFRLGAIERQLHAHRGGDFFGRHVDNGHGDVTPRRLSAVYYFYRTPRRFDGGALFLYDEIYGDGGRQIGPTCTAIEPLDNSIVFFPSGVTHEVEPVRRHDDDFGSSRFTITFWCRESDTPVPNPTAPLKE